MDDIEVELKLANLAMKEAEELVKKIEIRRSAPPYCSFCYKGKGQYLCCIEGTSNVRICNTCVLEAYELVVSELGDPREPATNP